MQSDLRRGGHHRDLLEEPVDVLLGRCHLASSLGVGDVPDRGRLVQAQRARRGGEHAGVDLEEQPEHRRRPRLGHHCRVDRRLARPRRVLNVAPPMTQPVCQSGSNPQRHREPQQQSPAGLLDPAIRRASLTDGRPRNRSRHPARIGASGRLAVADGSSRPNEERWGRCQARPVPSRSIRDPRCRVIMRTLGPNRRSLSWKSAMRPTPG
jgi:hypothetical protein